MTAPALALPLPPDPPHVRDYAIAVELAVKLLNSSVRELKAGKHTVAEHDRQQAQQLLLGLPGILRRAYEAEHDQDDECRDCQNPLFACCCEEIR